MRPIFFGYSESVRGHSHLTTGLPCQDSSAYALRDNYAISVVSDGHGSAPHFRSEIGSRMAVASAIAVIDGYMTEQKTLFDNLRINKEAILSKIAKSIIAQWVTMVDEYDSEHPLTNDELELISRNNIKIEDKYKRYGATLVAGVIFEEGFFGFQIGDGSLVILDENLRPTQPIPKDELCVFNYTTSICSSDAFDHFNCEFIDGKSVVAILTATDGFTTSFVSEESFYKQCSKIIGFLNNGGEWKSVVDNLEKRSSGNTEDDVSLSVIFIPGNYILATECIKDQKMNRKIMKSVGYRPRKGKRNRRK